ncbi:MAG: hypothetical protein PHI04_00060 [Clostridiaceae bacterium]|nr:hypothetical protein [Clostridiaceae bacterium]NLE23873.1 hypothetical protein [Clostridiaceae bacterium]HNR03217.1 hypothetical protein [Bacillota bacterium]HNT02982.1 hypothetical protein [Bacillota bacterium]
MTHTLHRKGDKEGLSNDYIVFAISAQTVNAKGSAPKFKEFGDIVLKYNPVNYGDMKTGNAYNVGVDKVHESYKDNSIVHAVFTEEDIVAKVLKELREADLGLSIVLSGIVEHTSECCHKISIEPHTIEYSLGIHGKTDSLPEDNVVEISTMCGHGMVSFSLIEHFCEEIEKGRITADEAARKLAKQCHCGVFNPTRAAEILRLMTDM